MFPAKSKYIELQDFQSQGKSRQRGRLLEGWRVGVFYGAVIAFVVLGFNVGLLAWANAHSLADDGHGIVTVFKGPCPQMSNISTWSHFAINILSTLLLSASACCMQCLSAPTREEVDRAHARHTWLDIGVSGIRNFRWLSTWRKFLWVWLGLSSIPLHLLYNSVILSTSSSNDYTAALVARNFVIGGPWNTDRQLKGTDVSQIQYLQSNVSSLVRLENADCIRAFANMMVSDYKNVLLVSNAPDYNNTLWETFSFKAGNDISTYAWMCASGACKTENDYVAQATNWTLQYPPLSWRQNPAGINASITVDHCLAEPFAPLCTISLSRTLLLTVILCNVVKVVGFLTALFYQGYQPLIVLGDAVASFLEFPDGNTSDQGPLSANDVRNGSWSSAFDVTCPSRNPSSRIWTAKGQSWFLAASPRRWVLTSLCCFTVWLTAIGILLIGGRFHNPISGNSVWNQGFGIVRPSLLIAPTQGQTVTTNVLIANSPQLLVSFVYLAYNGLFTCMLLSAENLRFSTHRKSLRVSNPVGTQRSTYWLQLPYRYALPLLAAMAALHWFISQSIFLARVTIIDNNGNVVPGRAINACGWSPTGIVASLILGGVMILALYAFGFRRYGDGMPIASSCSAAISAACHRAESEKADIVKVPLKYGVLEPRKDGRKRVGFSAGEVGPLVGGKSYN